MCAGWRLSPAGAALEELPNALRQCFGELRLDALAELKTVLGLNKATTNGRADEDIINGFARLAVHGINCCRRRQAKGRDCSLTRQDQGTGPCGKPILVISPSLCCGTSCCSATGCGGGRFRCHNRPSTTTTKSRTRLHGVAQIIAS
jgi:hypothetical protein